MANGDGKRIGSMLCARPRTRQQHLDHQCDLLLVGVTGTDNRLLDPVRRIFRNRQSGPGGNQERNSPRLAKFQRRGRIPGNECLLNSHCIGRMASKHVEKSRFDLDEAPRDRQPRILNDGTVRNVDKPRSGDFEHAPTGRAEARIDAENSERCRHGRLVLQTDEQQESAGFTSATGPEQARID